MAQRAGSEILRRIGDDPALLGADLQWVRGALPLRDQLAVDAVLKDSRGGAILLLVEDDPDVSLADLTARLVLVHGEVRASRPLLGELLEDRGLVLSHLMVVLPRAPDALLATADQLQDPAVEVRSIGELRGRPEPLPPPSEQAPPAPAEKAPDGLAGPPDPAGDTASPPIPRVVSPPPRPVTGPEQLRAEAKRRILRVSDAVEAEVDGALTRYRMRDQLLAVLEEEGGDGGFYLHVGRPLVRRAIRDSRDLASALDEILARFVATEEGPGERRVS